MLYDVLSFEESWFQGTKVLWVASSRAAWAATFPNSNIVAQGSSQGTALIDCLIGETAHSYWRGEEEGVSGSAASHLLTRHAEISGQGPVVFWDPDPKGFQDVAGAAGRGCCT